MDEKLLHGVAASAEEAATTLRGAVRAAGSGLAPAPQPGSAAALAAQAAENGWLPELGRLVRDTETFAANLAAAAKGYLAADLASADGLRRAGSGMPR